MNKIRKGRIRRRSYPKSGPGALASGALLRQFIALVIFIILFPPPLKIDMQGRNLERERERRVKQSNVRVGADME